MLRRSTLIVLVLGLAGLAVLLLRSTVGGDRFTRLMERGNGYLDQGDATNAIAAYKRVVKLAPDNLDARLNLANAFLLAGDAAKVVEQCREALALDHNSAAAYYLMGCANLRMNQAGPAVQALQQSEQIDSAVTALHFQLGLAQAQLGNLDDAISEFETVLSFAPEHPSLHYQLSLLYRRAGRLEDATREMQKHQELLAKNPPATGGPATFERCKYTKPRIAFVLEQPQRQGVNAPVRFADATAAAFNQPSHFHAPMAVLDLHHDGRNSLFVMEGETNFRVLSNLSGHFEPLGEPLPAKPGVHYRRCLAGDLNNDRVEDVIVLGEQGICTRVQIRHQRR